MVRSLVVLLSVAALGLAVPVHAQESEPEYGAPAHVAFVDGSATLEREGRTETSALNMPLLSGDRLRTADGRVEVVFEDGGALHLDERTTIDIQSDDLLRLTDGRIRLDIAGPSRDVEYRIDSPAGSVRITQGGEYRIALLHGDRETQLELAVLRGGGEIFTEQGSTPVRAGERAYASEGLAPSYPYVFNSANWDEFDRWSETRRDQRLGVSSQYLPRRCSRTDPCSISTATGATHSPMGMCGIRASRRDGVLIITVAGCPIRGTGGRGWASISSRGPRTTTADGAFRPARGSGSLATAGRRRMCPGRTRPAT